MNTSWFSGFDGGPHGARGFSPCPAEGPRPHGYCVKSLYKHHDHIAQNEHVVVYCLRRDLLHWVGSPTFVAVPIAITFVGLRHVFDLFFEFPWQLHIDNQMHNGCILMHDGCMDECIWVPTDACGCIASVRY